MTQSKMLQSPEDMASAALILHKAGQLAEAEAQYRTILEAHDPDHLNALQLLGVLMVDTARAEAGLLLLERAEVIASQRGDCPQHSRLYNNLGNAMTALSRHEEALAYYHRSLDLCPDDPEVHANLAGTLVAQGKTAEAVVHYETATVKSDSADWRHKLGQLYAAAGRPADAEASYRAALACDPAFTPALDLLGRFLRKNHRATEAIDVLERLLKHDPGHIEAHCTLGNALRDVGRVGDAVRCFARYCELLPNSADAYLYLGLTLSEAGEHDAAMPFINWALTLDPKSAIGFIELGNVLLRANKPAEAREAFFRATAIQQFITRQAVLPQPRFSALCVLIPGKANIPYDYLIGRGSYDAHMMWYLPGGDYDVAALHAASDVVLNMLSDADQGREVLSHVAAFVDGLGKPIINHPDRVARTDRASIARLAADITGCRAAHTVSVGGGLLAEGYWPADIFKVPFLARVAGRHNGWDFEKISCPDDLRAFGLRHPGADFYLMDYIDVRSPDGHFRKYRFFGIDGEILPYHLAIGDHWKVHHVSTDMANQSWMQREEEAFLEQPGAFFGKDQFAALSALVQAIGLDYMGIDCALDQNGNVVVFEANAAMLLHGNNAAFPYKDKHVDRIKAAFDAMLERRAAPRSRETTYTP